MSVTGFFAAFMFHRGYRVVTRRLGFVLFFTLYQFDKVCCLIGCVKTFVPKSLSFQQFHVDKDCRYLRRGLLA